MTAAVLPTERAGRLLTFLRAYIGEHGFAPTYGEMAAALDLCSKSRIHDMLEQLVERGAIKAMPRRPRAIQLSDFQTVRLPAGIAARLAADARRHGVPVEQHLSALVNEALPAIPAAVRQ